MGMEESWVERIGGRKGRTEYIGGSIGRRIEERRDMWER